MPTPSDRETWLRRAQSGLGLGPLALYALYHLICHWPALTAREAWVERVRTMHTGRVLSALLLLALIAHAVLGLRRLLHASRRRGGAARPPLMLMQALTGLLLAGFIAYHVATLPTVSGAHATLRDAYDELWMTLGKPLPLFMYVTGVSALAFHLGLGLVQALQRARPDLPVRALRFIVGAFALALWLAYLQLVAHFALGEALVPDLAPTPFAMPLGRAP